MNELSQRVIDNFERFSNLSPIIVRSPGRVNLIGEHTDYNNGFVLPAAIDKTIDFAMAANGTDEIRLFSMDMKPASIDISLKSDFKKSSVLWANYILGVIQELQNAGYRIRGFDCVFGGNIPIGAGLSSSAALEGGIVYGLSNLFDLDISKLEMALNGQKAENNFVGVQCGIMDQFANIHGKKDHVLRLDCRSLEYDYYPFDQKDVVIVLCDTKVRRKLAGSEYNTRRLQCEEGVRILNEQYSTVKSLRDVTIEMLEEHKNSFDPVIYKRCRYIINENQRVLDACCALQKNDLSTFGSLMFKSHNGLRNEYEVSCSELDILVEAAEQHSGILGARMMGGGFGGCTINLVLRDDLESVCDHLKKEYLNKTGIETEIHCAVTGEGVSIVGLSEEVLNEK